MKVQTMDEILTDKVMDQLIDEVIEYDANSWSSIAMRLNLYTALESVVPYPNGQPPVLVLRELYKLMKTKRVLVDDYVAAVQHVCFAALCRPAHKAFVCGSDPVVKTTNSRASDERLTKAQVLGIDPTRTVSLPASNPNPAADAMRLHHQLSWPDRDSIVLDLTHELVACGVSMDCFERVLDESFFNAFTAQVSKYRNMPPRVQLIEFLKYLRLRAYPLLKYKVLLAQCVPDVLNHPVHAKMLANV